MSANTEAVQTAIANEQDIDTTRLNHGEIEEKIYEQESNNENFQEIRGQITDVRLSAEDIQHQVVNT